MTVTNDEIFDELCRLIGPFNTKGVPLGRDTDIAADLNIDSVAVMDFVMEVEDRFDIDIPLNLLSDIRSMDDLAEVVEQRVKGSA